MSRSKSEIEAVIHPFEKSFSGIVKVPGSKSYTNRALIIASLTWGTSVIYDFSNSDDSLLLIRILRKLGIKITLDEYKIEVRGNSGKFKEFKGTINARNAGTVMRFLIALCSLIPGEIILKGTQRMHKRPVKGLVDALLQLGADITYLGETGYPPLKIKGGKLHGGKVEINASASSQFISALLLIAPALGSELTILATDEIISRPYIDMTIDLIQHFGAKVENKAYRHYLVKNTETYQPKQYEVEGDASCASYFFGIAAITQSTIRISNLSPISRQGDVRFADLLLKMGCTVKMDANKNYIEVSGVKELKCIEADMKDMPDVAPTLAVVAAFAKGTTIIKGVKNLELKESKRLTALQRELTKMGIECSTDGEQLRILGGNPKGAFINTYHDHRMAMAFAMAGTRINNLIIQSPSVVSKSFPYYWNVLQEIGIKIDFMIEAFLVLPNIVFIGFMGSGKTTIGKLLANKIHRPFYETDNTVLKLSGFKNINSIFIEKGEDFFREIEKKAISVCAMKNTSIISCGGGTVNDSENMKLLKKSGKMIYLSASFKTVCMRLKDDESRPLFKDRKKAKKLYLQRVALYQKYADMIIYTDKLTPEEVISNIISLAKIHDDNARAKSK